MATSRRFLAPEVVPVSPMDCGPACLASVLEGFRIPVNYDLLRDACQTGVDGTSIDVIETLAQELGLEAEQLLLPVEHVGLRCTNSLPAIVVNTRPDGQTHFVVAWRSIGTKFAVMDPIVGRRMVPASELRSELFETAVPVPTLNLTDWLRSDSYQKALGERLETGLRVPREVRDRLLSRARDTGAWLDVARLDAAIRMLTHLVDRKKIAKGADAAQILDALCSEARETPPEDSAIPVRYWRALPASDDDGTSSETHVLFIGAVVLQVRGTREVEQGEATDQSDDGLRQMFTKAPTRPLEVFLRQFGREGAVVTSWLLLALVLSVASTVVMILLFRAVIDVASFIATPYRQVAAVAAAVVLAIAALALELLIYKSTLDMGRSLELRLRTAFLRKIPRLHESFFRSRLTSDMAERFHSIHTVRNIPELAAQVLRLVLQMAFAAAFIIWIDPGLTVLVLIAVTLSIALPLILQPLTLTLDLRQQAHAGALSVYYLDSLLALVPVLAHGAERTVLAQHDNRLGEWFATGARLNSIRVAVGAGLRLVGAAAATLMLLVYLERSGTMPESVLLLIFWALQIPALGAGIALNVQLYGPIRNRTLRLLEPLMSEESQLSGDCADPAQAGRSAPATGLALTFSDVSVRVAGREILGGIDLHIEPGMHVAIVGESGAGKSSFVGLLLGWHKAETGQLLVDGQVLDDERLAQVRQQTAWVDPSVQLWNRTLLYNVRYGQSPQPAALSLDESFNRAGLHALLHRLEHGMQTVLGEGGGLVSGGEGQRVRFARALATRAPRLVILDEAFRGLARDQRTAFLQAARDYGAKATMLCVTHDVCETADFDHVLVIRDGRIAESGAPAALRASPESHYARMLAEEQRMQARLRERGLFRELHLEDGRLRGQE